MITVKQLETGGYDSNFSYVLSGEQGETAVIDPCGDVEKIRNALPEKCIPKYILLTHSHHDHISGINSVLEFFRAPVAAYKTSGYHQVDIPLSHNDKLSLNNDIINCLHAPGHTDDSMIYHLDDDSAVFTGDTLFVDYIGFCRAKEMYNTLKNIVFPLNDSNIVFSGHNYGHKPFRKLGEEKKSNPFLNPVSVSFEKFKKALTGLS